MATTLKTTLPDTCLSSMLPDIEWTTNAKQVTVTLTADDATAPFLTSELWAHDGTVCLYEVREAVEKYMRAHDLAAMTLHVSISAIENTATVKVIYCDKVPPGDVDNLLTSRFLTTATWKPLPPEGITETLSFCEPIAEVDVTPTFLVSLRDSAGDVRHVTLTASENLTATGTVQTVLISTDAIRSHLAQVVESDFELLALNVRVGSRSMQYYRQEPHPNAAFLFMNCFNVPELALLQCATTTKTKDERKIGYVGRRRVKYNPNRTVEHEVQTAPMPMEQARWIDQLVTSPTVWLTDGAQVVITDGECEVSDDNAALSSVKFTWMYSDARGSLTMPEAVQRIFTEEFTYQFR